MFRHRHIPLVATLIYPLRTAITTLFFITTPPPPETSTLSLHDALPISLGHRRRGRAARLARGRAGPARPRGPRAPADRKSTRLNSSHVKISYAVFCLKKKKRNKETLSAAHNRYHTDATLPSQLLLEYWS